MKLCFPLRLACLFSQLISQWRSFSADFKFFPKTTQCTFNQQHKSSFRSLTSCSFDTFCLESLDITSRRKPEVVARDAFSQVIKTETSTLFIYRQETVVLLSSGRLKMKKRWLIWSSVCLSSRVWTCTAAPLPLEQVEVSKARKSKIVRPRCVTHEAAELCSARCYRWAGGDGQGQHRGNDWWQKQRSIYLYPWESRQPWKSWLSLHRKSVTCYSRAKLSWVEPHL